MTASRAHAESTAGRRPVTAWLARALLPLALVAATFAAFWPALSAEFVAWDDDRNFVANMAFRGLGARNVEWMFTTFHMGPYQPLAWLTLGLDHELWGMDARGYHLTNVVLHALAAVAFYFMALKMLAVAARVVPGTNAARMAAFVAAFAFAIHPLRVESVAWVTERRDVLCGLFSVLAVNAWLVYATSIGTRRRAAWWAALVLFMLALGSKASAMMLPAVLLVLDVWPLCRWRQQLARCIVEKVPMILLAIACGAVAVHGQSLQGETLRSLDQHGLAPRIAQAAYGLVFYPLRTLLPARLSPLYEMPQPLDPASLLFGGAIVLALAITFALVILRRRHPGLLAAWIAFAILLAPVSGLTQAGPQLVADRYSYFACMPFALLAGGAVFVLWSRVRRTVLVVTLCALGVVLGLLTLRQTRFWHDSETLWRRAIAVDPTSPNALVNLGSVLVQRGLATEDRAERARWFDEAQMFLERGVATRPQAEMHVALGLLAMLRAQDDLDQRLLLAAQALGHIDRGLTLGEAQRFVRPEWRLSRASALMAAGRCAEAVSILEDLRETAPATDALARTLGFAYDCVGRKAEALEQLEVALRAEPEDTKLWLRIGELAAAFGRPDDARDAFRRVLDLRRAQVGVRVTQDPEWRRARQALDQLQ